MEDPGKSSPSSSFTPPTALCFQQQSSALLLCVSVGCQQASSSSYSCSALQQQQLHLLQPLLPVNPSTTRWKTMENKVLQNEVVVVRRAGRQAVVTFLEAHNCFSVCRTSGKVVVFDTRIPIQLAFYALVEHDMLSAPLWDPMKCRFTGLLTVTDFIDILRQYRADKMDVSTLAVSTIATVLQQPRPFTGADASCTLKQAAQTLLESGNDFLPIVFAEDMRVLACITYTNILEHLVTHFREQRRLFDDSVHDLGIGTYTDVVTVTPETSLADALKLMHEHRLAALPVVDANGKVLGMYSRSDITFLTKAADAQDAVRNLDLTVQDVLSQTRQDVTTPDALRTCSPASTLQAVFEAFAVQRFNRLCVVDEQEKLLGVVSARDLVAYFMSDREEDTTAQT